MTFSRVCVLGGTGFVGRRIVHALMRRGIGVVVPTRQRSQAMHLAVLPMVDLVQADVREPAALARVLGGCDAAVNLVGILHERGHYAGSFQRMHVDFARETVAACMAAGVRRLLHMSALGADPSGPSAYQRSKGEAEQIVRSSSLDWTLFRPSVVFGPGDSFLGLFARLQRLSPVVPLAGADTRFQPVFVDDVARAFGVALTESTCIGQSYDLCGPEVFTLADLVRLTGTITGRPRAVIGLPHALAWLLAGAMERLPNPLMTRDNLRSMSIDNVCGCPFPAVFGGMATSLRTAAPGWLGGPTGTPR